MTERIGMSLLLVFIAALAGGGVLSAVLIGTGHYWTGWKLGSSVAAFLMAVWCWRDKLFGTDGRDKHQAVKFTVNEVTHDGKEGKASEFPVSQEKIISLAIALLIDDEPFTEAALCGRWNMMTRIEFVAVRAEMVRRGWAEQVSPITPQRGYRITDHGWDRLR